MAAQPARERPLLPSTAPLALWLFLQMAVLVLAATRVPLAAQHPEPAERMAAHLVFGTQVVAAALLFPFLFRDVRTAVQVIATAVPFQFAAGSLAGLSPAAVGLAGTQVVAWMATLSLYTPLLPGPRRRAIGIAAASLLTIGFGALRYLILEFGAASGVGGVTLANVSPLLSTFALLNETNSRGWISILLLATGPLAVAALQRRARGSRVPKSPPLA